MKRTKILIIEIVKDHEPRKKESEATAIRRFSPDTRSLHLYCTSDGQIGTQINLNLNSRDRHRLDKAYNEITKILIHKSS
jgi:hypothetical protein